MPDAPRRRGATLVATVLLALLLAACGSTTILHRGSPARSGSTGSAPTAAAPSPSAEAGSPDVETIPSHTSTPTQLGVPYIITKNTTRIAGSDPASDAAAVALAVFPSQAAGTHPSAVTLAPADDWEAALAAASLMGAPFRAPELLSGPGSLPSATTSALTLLAPTGDAALANAQVVRVGDVPTVPGALKSTRITGSGPYALSAAIATFEAKQRGHESRDVIVASSTDPAYAEVAAGYIAESGEPLLFVGASGIPAATAAQLRLHTHAHIYLLGPASVLSDATAAALGRYGTVQRIAGNTPAAESVNFAAYRDPACPAHGQCAHVPGSFGWAIRSPGHGYVLLNQASPLDAAAASALSSSGSYGPQLLVADANKLPQAVLNYFLAYATPGYTSEGPTAAVYNHAWLIGGVGALSEAVQAQVDSILEVQAVSTP